MLRPYSRRFHHLQYVTVDDSSHQFASMIVALRQQGFGGLGLQSLHIATVRTVWRVRHSVEGQCLPLYS